MFLTRSNIIALGLVGLVLANGACGVIAASVAGGVVAGEIGEDDGRFDPLENTDAGKEVYGEVYE